MRQNRKKESVKEKEEQTLQKGNEILKEENKL